MAYHLPPNQLTYLVTPENEKTGLHIHQNAYISRIQLEKEKTFHYALHHSKNGLYLMCIDGNIEIQNHPLKKRDAIGIRGYSGKYLFLLKKFSIRFTSHRSTYALKNLL